MKGRHIRRTRVLASLSPWAQAFLCDCPRCYAMQLEYHDRRAELNRLNSQRHPPCPFCGHPMVWRGACFVCPYVESMDLHQRVANQGGARCLTDTTGSGGSEPARMASPRQGAVRST